MTPVAARRAKVLDAQYRAWGEAAVWTPLAQTGEAVTVRRAEEDQLVEYGEASRTVASTVFLRVRTSELAQAAKGAVVEFIDPEGAVTARYVVIDKPLKVRFGLEWRCEARAD